MEPSIIGVDEVNFSPSIAGDCIVCACYLLKEAVPGLLKDSKKTSLTHRLRAFAWLQVNSIYCVEVASVNHIGRIGVYSARNLAAYRAVHGLAMVRHRQAVGQISNQQSVFRRAPYKVVVDGNPLPELENLWAVYPVGDAELTFMVGADGIVPEVSAASIIARVHADALFEGWEKYWPGFGMNTDHGSPSELHKVHLRSVGPSPIHRSVNYATEWWADILAGKVGGEVSRCHDCGGLWPDGHIKECPRAGPLVQPDRTDAL